MTKKRLDSFISSSKEDTETFAHNLGLSLSGKPTVFALHGDLGAGKTTFVRGMCKSALADTRSVSSPTFTYLHIYLETPEFSIYHFDLYRLHSAEEFSLAGFDEYLNKPSWCFLEWPERIDTLIPLNALHITLSHLEENKRLIEVEYA